MDFSSDNVSMYDTHTEQDKRFDEIEQCADREKYVLPKVYKFNKKETKAYYEWLDDSEFNPGFALSWYEFIDKINRSRKARNSKRKMINV